MPVLRYLLFVSLCYAADSGLNHRKDAAPILRELSLKLKKGCFKLMKQPFRAIALVIGDY